MCAWRAWICEGVPGVCMGEYMDVCAHVCMVYTVRVSVSVIASVSECVGGRIGGYKQRR